MPSNYDAIRRDNIKRYGTDIARIGKMLLADRYDDRAHFIYELLQNTEDALGRCTDEPMSRRVEFELETNELRLTHFGQKFSEEDVRGVCGIAESTKSSAELGRFGIGFKSVYTFTDSPEIHSGDEHFAVEHYVKPKAVDAVALETNQTLIKLPLKDSDDGAADEIARGLRKLGARSLLFLNQIEEIFWSLPNGESGIVLRSTPKHLARDVRKVTLIGQKEGEEDTDQTWIVMRREVSSKQSNNTGQLELAFSVVQDEKTQQELVRPIDYSTLIVYFPTALSTNLGFLLQGPFRTTPSRDNIPKTDAWNQQLINETGDLLSAALLWLRDNDLLTTAALECLPLDESDFPEDSLFEPIYDSTVKLLSEKNLLPTNNNEFTSATQAKLARTKELRDLLSPDQLADLFESDEPLYWLSGDITADKKPVLRSYCIHDLGIQEVTPETFLAHLDSDFLSAQSDEWILRLYKCLEQQSSLHKRLEKIPFVRLENGQHTVPAIKGQPQAFIAGEARTDFPTVRDVLTKDDNVLMFLAKFRITTPDPVDDVVQTVLPKYAGDEIEVTDGEYASDIERILLAFSTDSKAQRDKLVAVLKESTFVMAVDAGDNSEIVVRPTEVHLATQRLLSLLSGVNGLYLVDSSYECLKGEAIRELLETCNAVRHLRPIDTNGRYLTKEEKEAIRKKDGRETTSGINDSIWDYSLTGLDRLLTLLPKLDARERSRRSKQLWLSLIDLEDRRGHGIFQGEYRWSYYGHSTAKFATHFIRLLNRSNWVAGDDGELHAPRAVLFESLDWPPNPFLQTQIEFRPPAIDELARESGIEPDVLDLLKACGLTSVDQLRSRLGMEEAQEDNGDVYDEANDLYGDMPDSPTIAPSEGEEEQESIGEYQDHDGNTPGGGNRTNAEEGGASDFHGGGPSRSGAKRERSANSKGGRPFISYLGTSPEDMESDPDGLDHKARMSLEDRAIEFILAEEPNLQRTPTNNPGFDLLELDGERNTIRWVEVKAMTGTLKDRPVGLSKRQFDLAQKEKSKYWIYIVENADNEETARVLRIQDPATKTRTFTFDRGWVEVAR